MLEDGEPAAEGEGGGGLGEAGQMEGEERARARVWEVLGALAGLERLRLGQERE